MKNAQLKNLKVALTNLIALGEESRETDRHTLMGALEDLRLEVMDIYSSLDDSLKGELTPNDPELLDITLEYTAPNACIHALEQMVEARKSGNKHEYYRALAAEKSSH